MPRIRDYKHTPAERHLTLKRPRNKKPSKTCFILVLAIFITICSLEVQYTLFHESPKAVVSNPAVLSKVEYVFQMAAELNFQDWINLTRSTLSYHCQVPDKPGSIQYCYAAKKLGYQKWTRHSREKPFIFTMPNCPIKFRHDAIYVCNRAISPWINKMMKRKRDMWMVYNDFDILVHNAMSKDFRDCFNSSLDSFFPKIYPLRYRKNVAEFQNVVQQKMESKLTRDDEFILKWARGGHGGAGFKMLDLSQTLEFLESYKLPGARDQTEYIAQVYNNRPFLWNEKKFAIRTWAVILSDNPLMITFHDGFMTVCVEDYYNHPEELHKFATIPNAVRQHPNFTREMLHQAKKDFSSFERYLLEDRSHRKYKKLDGSVGYLPENWFRGTVIPEMISGMRYVLAATWGISESNIYFGSGGNVKKTGWFNTTQISFICYDWIVDDNAKLWLHEENHGCGLIYGTGMDYLPQSTLDMFNSLQVQSLKLSEEIFYRKQRNLPYGFKHLTTSLGRHLPIIDHTEITHIGRRKRPFCSSDVDNLIKRAQARKLS